MMREDRPQFMRAVGASLLLHLVSAGFFWKVDLSGSRLEGPSSFMVRLVPSEAIPRFIDQAAAPPADRPVTSRDISQVTSQARGPGKSPGPVTSPESRGGPQLPQSSSPPPMHYASPPGSSASPPKPPAKPSGSLPETPTVAPPVLSVAPSGTPRKPSKAPPDISLEVPETRPPSSGAMSTPRDVQEGNAPEPHVSLPSLQEQIAALGKERLFGQEKDFDAGQAGNTGTDERTVSLETESAEFAPYLATVKHRIERRWVIPRFAREVGLTGNLVLRISITREGKLARLQIDKSSGVSILDEAAVTAVTSAAPYGPFPTHYTYRQLNIVANFEYISRPATIYQSR